jgi:hypothetical protein
MKCDLKDVAIRTYFMPRNRQAVSEERKSREVKQEAQQECLDHFIELSLFTANREGLYDIGTQKPRQQNQEYTEGFDLSRHRRLPAYRLRRDRCWLGANGVHWDSGFESTTFSILAIKGHGRTIPNRIVCTHFMYPLCPQEPN